MISDTAPRASAWSDCRRLHELAIGLEDVDRYTSQPSAESSSMSIDALVSGRLHRAPKQHTASSGMLYTTATVRTATRDGNAIFVSVIAFESEPANALLALAEGDSVALAGELTPQVWKPKDGGEPRPALDLCVHAVLTEYHVARRRKAMQEARSRADNLPFNDDVPRGAA